MARYLVNYLYALFLFCKEHEAAGNLTDKLTSKFGLENFLFLNALFSLFLHCHQFLLILSYSLFLVDFLNLSVFEGGENKFQGVIRNALKGGRVRFLFSILKAHLRVGTGGSKWFN